MTLRTLFAVLLVAAGIGMARPDTHATSDEQSRHSATSDDQSEVSLTVYNSDLALVRDVRSLQLPSGVGSLRFVDIAATVNPATVHFRSLSDPRAVSVLEQNYEYDLLDPDKLLRKYVGRDVTLVRTRAEGGVARQENVTATLLSYNTAPVWKIGNEIVTGMNADHIRFPELPDTLYSRPTLVWTVQNDGASTHLVETSYLARSLAWNADYVLTVGRDDRSADLNGWVTMTNNSGTAFRNATVQFVAGDLNRVRQHFKMLSEDRMAAPASAPAPMTQESFSDYHLYTLGRKTTIANAQTKQLSLLQGTNVPVTKKYVVEGQYGYYHNAMHPGSPIKDAVQVYYEFRNDQQGGLGMPLPAGVLRVYQQDSKGGVQFVGEDRIDHTPKDETLNVKIGNAFDVACDRKQIDFERIATNVYELEYEITLRNHKDTAVRVDVNEPLGGTWRVISSSFPAAKTSSSSASFAVPVSANGAAVLTYRVRVTY